MVRRLAHQAGDNRVTGRHTRDRRRNARGLGECFDVGDLIGRHHRHHDALGPGARGSTRAVKVGLVLSRWIDVNHQGDVVHMDAACGDIGGHEHFARAVGKGLEIALTSVLRKVAVQLHCGDARLSELLSELLGAVFRAHKKQ